LKISLGERDRDEDLEYLKTIVDLENARKLLTAISRSESKIIVIYKRDSWFRAKLSYALAKMFAIHNVAEYIVTVEKPIENILIEFAKAVMVLDKMIPVRRGEDWTVIKIAEDVKEKGVEADIEATLKKLGY